MINRRKSPDGLPFRVYERAGKFKYSIGYKLPGGKWAFSYSCPADDDHAIKELRSRASREASLIGSGLTTFGPTEELINAWLTWQDALPMKDANRRAESTLKENRREAKNLVQAFGHIEPQDITKTDGYTYLDACAEASRAAKGNKEIALLRLILEWGVRRGRLTANPLQGIRKLKTTSTRRLVSEPELMLALERGRAHGGSRHIVALALMTAFLCVRRSVEVRAITRDAIQDRGIVWHDGKDKSKPAVVIQWTPQLRSIIDEVPAVKRNHVAGTLFLFGNMRGQRYTKGGWKAILDDLMHDCESVAQSRHIEFRRFSLQDCRPAGLTEKLSRGHTDAKDAMGHTTDRMIGQVYDRRVDKTATPVR